MLNFVKYLQGQMALTFGTTIHQMSLLRNFSIENILPMIQF